jgi:Sigma-70, region 4
MNADHTLEEVGQQFSLTRERIRQIEARALRKLKHLLAIAAVLDSAAREEAAKIGGTRADQAYSGASSIIEMAEYGPVTI